MFPPSPKRGERVFPFSPLMAASGCESFAELAAVTGYTAKTIQGWAAKDSVPMSACDWMACRCGFHPINIWGRDFQAEPHTVAEGAAEDTLTLWDTA